MNEHPARYACRHLLERTGWTVLSDNRETYETLYQHDDEPSTWLRLRDDGCWWLSDENEPPTDRPGWEDTARGGTSVELRDQLILHMVSKNSEEITAACSQVHG